MRCSRCGVEAPALKTCRWRTGGRRRFVLCGECYTPIAGVVWIVPGPVPCFGTCRRCGEWVSVREISERTGGGKWDAPSGVCAACSGQ